MSQVLHLNIRSQHQPEGQRHAALLDCFAHHRRYGDDVFWLKENAELLNILECTGARLEDEALEAYHGFYERAEKRLAFFPQYYRFVLSITLDLEDLGFGGDKGAAMAAWIARRGLPDAELSDLQRLEARRLLARRGFASDDDAGLETRVRRFIEGSATFALPNKKAAYELTHIVFYLSEYGRRDPDLGPGAVDSLHFAGMLAYLDQNADLLAEICIALRYAGQPVPDAWEDWIARVAHRFAVLEDSPAGQDDYHEYFVCNWLLATAGRDRFAKRFAHGRMAFHRAETGLSALRELSQCIFDMDDSRQDDWGAMRPRVRDSLGEDAWRIVCEAERASGRFDAFFSGFARAGTAIA